MQKKKKASKVESKAENGILDVIDRHPLSPIPSRIMPLPHSHQRMFCWVCNYNKDVNIICFPGVAVLLNILKVTL